MKAEYKETQRFNQIWLWLLLAVISIWSLGPITLKMVQSFTGETPQPSILFFVIIWLFIFGINALLFSARLKTTISKEEISITFTPLFWKPMVIKWADVEEAYVREYKPLSEFGGWGVRYTFKGRAYNTSGRMGLQLVLKSDKKILIGTQHPERIRAFIKKHVNIASPATSV